jgi:hypothetical protein
MNLSVYIHKHPFGRKPLGTVRSDGIAVIEVAHLAGVEAYIPAFRALHSDADLAIFPDTLNGAEIAIGNLQVLRWCSELDFVSNGKLTLNFAVRRDAAQP